MFTTPSKYLHKSSKVPSIRISGKYLESLGININDTLTIFAIENGTIQLSKKVTPQSTLKTALMDKYNATQEEAELLISLANTKVMEGSDPAAVLREEFALPPDIIDNIIK